jgi:3-phenylpropionate/trans-cinnamate dioxygenase ferredoxin reductase component
VPPVDVGVVIVGAGEAGARVAVGLRAGGYERPISIVGDEFHAPYERPPLSKASILAEDEPPPPTIADARDLAGQGIDVRAGTRVVQVDRTARQIRLSDGSAIVYDKAVLATGARARTLKLPGGEWAHTLRTHEDSLRIRAAMRNQPKVAVIGGGLIGLELAASARALGCEVSVVEAAPRILTRGVPEKYARQLAERHRRAGVTLYEGRALSEIRKSGGALQVALADGERIAADFIVAGIGAEPNVDLAVEAKLEVSNGVIVDSQLRSSDEKIFAVGDCANFPLALFGGRRVRLEAWRNAFDQGAYLAQALLGGSEPYRAVPWFWSDQYEVTLQIAGMPDFGAAVVARELGDGFSMQFHLAGDGVVVGACALGPLNVVAKDMRLAEMLIAKGARPSPEALADPGAKLKALLPR